MSSISLKFKVLDSLDPDFGNVNMSFNDGNQNISLPLRVSGTVSTYFAFRLIPFMDGVSGEDNFQAIDYRASFNRDYGNIGGNNNLVATVSGSTVTITAKTGTFNSASYIGNRLLVSVTISNTNQPDPKTFSFTQTSNGSCSQIEYTAQAATGGTPPYRLNLLGNDVFSGWNGNDDVNFNLDRGKAYSGILFDSFNASIRTISIRPPRNILAGDFKTDGSYLNGFADVSVRVVTEVSGTTPLEFNLVDSENNETGWQQSTIFGGQLPGLYTLKVRDRFLCEVSKVFEVYDLSNVNSEENARYFNISDFNSLSFAEKKEIGFDVRPNYENTLSHQEKIGIPYQSVYRFPSTTVLKTQFKSSYDIHVCTLLKSDGTKTSLPLEQTQENIGTVERVDCKIFPILEDFGGGGSTNTGTGVFFEGGNNYVPNSSTLASDPSSPYNAGLPEWAKVGNIVSLAGIGTHQIVATDLYDDERETLYFKIDETIQTEVAEIIQVQYSRHPYNVYRCDFDMSLIDDHAKVVIEAGWSFEQIERRFDSEVIKVLEDPNDYLKITWSSDVNFDDMIFSDGIDCEMWVKGRIRPFPIGSSDTKESDDRTRSLKQRHRMGQRLFIPALSTKQWHKLGLASGIADDGLFTIEDMVLVSQEPVDAEEIGDTNVSNITAEYAYGSENLAIKDDEIILIPSTGKTGTAQTGKEPVNDPTIKLLRLDGGKWIQTLSGKYISLNV